MLELQKFIQEHSDWENLLKQPPYCLKISYDCEVVGFNYNQIESDFSNLIVQEARGIWLYRYTYDVACHSFDKFFNYGEQYAANVDWSTAEVQEKIDGSLMKVWFNKITKEWMLSTNGTIDACKAPTGDIILPTFWHVFQKALTNNDLTWEKLTEKLMEEYTYTFELVSPQTRVVIPYEKPDLYLIGIRSNYTNYEVVPESLNLGIKRPKKFPINTIESAIESASKLPWDEEGYVAVDSSFHRIKIKSSEWIKAHYVRNNNVVTKSVLVETILNGEQNEFLTYASEYKQQLEKIETQMKQIYETFKNCFYTMMNLELLSPKDYAQIVKKQPTMVQDYLFKFNNGTFVKQYLSSWSINKWCDILDSMEEAK